METFKVGLIRVLTTEDQEVLLAHGKTIMEIFPGIEVETKCIPDQYEGIHSEELCRIAIPKIVETAKTFQDADMLIVSCADDPGVEEIRKEIPGIPVTGGGETTAALALKYGEKIGVLGITDYAPAAYRRLLYGKMILGKPDGVDSTLDLLTPEGRASTLKKGMELKEQGAQVIALACTGLGTIGIAGELEETTGLPVIDPVIAEGLFAYFEKVRRSSHRIGQRQ
ncbi:aspartate/glutamate racemase family protein [Faecalicatena orotica]|uniref:Asp/Glu/hydantoin racemase n=1 Tax=Faecalicatena orotica TaxID=1544 RepID=A0A2Y9BAH5_9FIRM|nr:aspartate/glutamate racemase family protein [Faecalicatena orotica]PWJ31253.1 Asp/Glu/hydantoin racemase [Faecalicatena orotica]SSA54459.1 Asp/Glu/hydantoin racemase [Faecalicatena orotica]